MRQTCIIVGVGPGIGLSVAKRFAVAGFSVGMIARNESNLGAYALELEELELGDTKAATAVADVEKPEAITHALKQLSDELGQPSVLVYNAAVIRPALPSQLGAEALVREFRVNVAGALVASQAVLASMRKAKAGTILFTGGGLALRPWPQMASLAVGKAGIRSLALTLGQEVANDGIHVATVTIDGLVGKGGLEPAKIADHYLALSQEPPGAWTHELVLDQTGASTKAA